MVDGRHSQKGVREERQQRILGEWLSGNVLQGLLRSHSYKEQKPDHTGLLFKKLC